jgi:3-hydroxypropanoate dehydrogenase
MSAKPLSNEALAQLFTEARTHHAWTDAPVPDAVLREVYELMKWGPTSVNANPIRIAFIKSNAEKEKLYPTLAGSNVAQVRAAPVTAIVAYDAMWLDHIARMFPAMDVVPYFKDNEKLISDTAFRNSSLQGAYLILAARALGLDAGPMSGFDNASVDKAFFNGTSWKSNFICTLGYGDHSKLYPRGPRFDFDEVCKIL